MTATVKISELPDGGYALSDLDTVPIVQNGVTRRCSIGQIRGITLVPINDIGVPGEPGYGVGICDYLKLPEGMRPLPGCQLSKLHDLLGGDPNQCPNYVATWWTPQNGTPALIPDCAPKRTMIMIQDLYNQQVRLQAAQEEQRNKSNQVLQVMGLAASAMKKASSRPADAIAADQDGFGRAIIRRLTFKK